jgi:hypothetical protein
MVGTGGLMFSIGGKNKNSSVTAAAIAMAPRPGAS